MVDDAIVVIENISRLSKKAKNRWRRRSRARVKSAYHYLADLLTDCSVDPTAIYGDIVGRLFREFAITLAVAILTQPWCR